MVGERVPEKVRVCLRVHGAGSLRARLGAPVVRFRTDEDVPIVAGDRTWRLKASHRSIPAHAHLLAASSVSVIPRKLAASGA